MAITAKKVEAGQEIKSTDHNALVDDVTALDVKPSKGDKGEKGDPGEKGATGVAGKDGFGTEAQYNDIIARLEALEA